MKIINILGTDYTLVIKNEKKDKRLVDCDGFCDKTTKEIVIEEMEEHSLGNIEDYRKKVIRHEIIHAFMFESGMHGCAIYEPIGSEHPEQLVDWFAIQYPKMKKVFEELGV